MQRYRDTVLKEGPSGLQPTRNASITVFNHGTDVIATIYDTNAYAPKGNPFQANAQGAFYFYAENGRYDVLVRGNGVEVRLDDVLMEDVIDELEMQGNELVQTASDLQNLQTDYDLNSVKKAPLASDSGAPMVGYRLGYTGAFLRNLLLKASENPSVYDAGAVGDGVANDAVAIGRALGWATPITLPGTARVFVSTGNPPRYFGPGLWKRSTGPWTPATPWTLLYRSDRMLSGMEPTRLNASVFQIRSGFCADSLATDNISFPATTNVDITTTGLNGLDVGSPVFGTSYFPYALKNSDTGAVGIVFSKEVSANNVTKPTGFDRIRKIPWGFVYLAAGVSRPAGIPGYHFSGWGADIVYTDFGTTADWRVLQNGAASTFTAFNVLAFVPENARLVKLVGILKTNASGALARANVRVSGAAGTGAQIAAVQGIGAETVVYFDHRLTSGGDILYNVSGGGTIDFYVQGYAMTEPS